MPLNSAWEDEAATSLRLTLTQPWNWNDLHKGMRRNALQLDATGGPVELLLDLRQSPRLPLGAFGHIRSLGLALHPRMRDRLIIIGLEPTLAAMLGGADGSYSDGRRLLRFVEDDAGAAAVLAEWRAAADGPA